MKYRMRDVTCISPAILCLTNRQIENGKFRLC
nr:MAG TPA: hypothetical protein [Caudoviricetes sp.]